jgi:hypothetical protein
MAGSTRLNILKQRIGAKTIHSSPTEEHIFYLEILFAQVSQILLTRWGWLHRSYDATILFGMLSLNFFDFYTIKSLIFKLMWL